MVHTKKAGKWIAGGLALATAAAPIASQAKNPFGSILLGGGVAVAVSKFGPQINDFINKLTGNKDEGAAYVTKVVPVISAGRGVSVGAVQVAGPEHDINQVKAVAQLEGQFGSFRIKGLIPVDTLNPTAKPSRVRNVGITGIVDVRL